MNTDVKDPEGRDMPSMQRYRRQTVLGDFGELRQRRLVESSVLVVGAGGLGCSALQHLAGAGVGRIGIVDHDMVSLENLHRQVLYDMGDIGTPKTSASARRLRNLNPDIEVIEHRFPLTHPSCLELFPVYDLVLDCSDNFPTRFMVNDACVLLGKALVSAAVTGYEGQVAVFNLPDGSGREPVHYRDLLPSPPVPGTVANCEEAGVMASLPGMMGAMQAGEALKILTGIGTPLSGTLLTYSMKDNRFLTFEISKRPPGAYGMPSDVDAFLRTDYAGHCRTTDAFCEIGPERLEELVGLADTRIVDLREPGEEPPITGFEHLRIPLSVTDWPALIPEKGRIVLVCQRGLRSRDAARRLASASATGREVYSLEGGVDGWMHHKRKGHA